MDTTSNNETVFLTAPGAIAGYGAFNKTFHVFIGKQNPTGLTHKVGDVTLAVPKNVASADMSTYLKGSAIFRGWVANCFGGQDFEDVYWNKNNSLTYLRFPKGFDPLPFLNSQAVNMRIQDTKITELTRMYKIPEWYATELHLYITQQVDAMQADFLAKENEKRADELVQTVSQDALLIAMAKQQGITVEALRNLLKANHEANTAPEPEPEPVLTYPEMVEAQARYVAEGRPTLDMSEA